MGKKDPILAIDWGEKRIGLAISDELGLMGHPYGIIPNDDKAVTAIASVVADRAVTTVVIGLPLTLAGEEGAMASAVRAFGERLRGMIPAIKLEYLDERLTSKTADAARRYGGKKKRRTGKEGFNDDRAAALLLSTYLDIHYGDEPPATER